MCCASVLCGDFGIELVFVFAFSERTLYDAKIIIFDNHDSQRITSPMTLWIAFTINERANTTLTHIHIQ